MAFETRLTTGFLSQIEPSGGKQHNPQYDSRVDARAEIVRHDAGSTRKTLQISHRPRLRYVEEPEEQKRSQRSLPGPRGQRGQGNPLAQDFVHHYQARVFLPDDLRRAA